MGFVSKNGLTYYQFGLFEGYPIQHAIFTRHGGVSPRPYDSLNIGGNLGDQDENIIENKKRIFSALDIPFSSQYDVWQVHGTTVDIPESPREPLASYVQADAILTRKTSLTLVMRFADCVPILLYSPQHHVAGIVHAGWKGTVRNTVGAAIRKMRDQFGVLPREILAAIGPSIGPDHYTIKDDVAYQFKTAFGQEWEKVIKWNEGEISLDLWTANIINLQQSGVENIDQAGICTACNTQDWYSHRVEHGNTGRFCALIKLQ